MPLNHMTTYAPIRRQGTLQIDRIARLQTPQTSAPKRLWHRIDTEAVLPSLSDSEASSINRDTIFHLAPFKDKLSLNDETCRLKLCQCAYLFNDSCEHWLSPLLVLLFGVT